MLGPLGVRQPHIAPTAVRTASGKAVRRLVLVQCDRCGCKGSGSTTPRGRLTSTNIAATRHPAGRLVHTCGGRLVAFDIEEGTL